MARPKKQIEYEISEAGCFNIVTDKKKPVIRSGSKTYKVGRFVYEECFGEVPEGFRVVHKCMNERCMNPEHLKLSSEEEAMKDIFFIREQRAKNDDGLHMTESFVRLAKYMKENYDWDDFEAAKQLGYTFEAFIKGLRSYQ